ncbi:MAG: hypothetical protein WCC14_20780 [Acidobacteriaceae bacterium]
MTRLLIRTSFAATLLLASVAFAQQIPPGVTGPIPAAIVSAKTIFISNGGSDSGLFPSPFSGDQDRPYNQFYKALSADSHYQLVSDPGQADLVLELRLLAPLGPSNPNKAQGAPDPEPQFRLEIYDRRTHYVLWTLTQSIRWAILQKTHDHNFDDALTELVNAFEALGQSQSAPAAASSTSP